MKYSTFLSSKAITSKPVGIDVELSKLNQTAFDWQQVIIRWALLRGRAALFEDCGLGKSIQQLEWAFQVCIATGGNVLIVAPLMVSHQTKLEGAKFGYDVNICRTQADVKSGINITNYEMIEHFEQNAFMGVVLDECFAPNTLVDVFDNGIVLKKYIKDIRENEIISNASGRDRVIECHRRKIVRAVKVSIGVHKITASEHHPFFTQRGWVQACDLKEGDHIMETSEAVRLVSNGSCSEIPGILGSEILRDILLSEMEDASNINTFESSQFGSCREEIGVAQEMVQSWKSRGSRTNREDSKSESDDRSIGQSEGEPDIAEDETQTFRAWRKREGYDEAAIVALGGVTEWMGERVCRVSGNKDSRLSDFLQIGFGESDPKDRHRSGWFLSSFQKGSGCQENRQTGFVRVEGIEILEQGHPELEQWRNADGFVYFYDLKAARHPSYSVNGLLVHNSSRLKNFTGKFRNTFISMFRRTKFKLACTATPAPNDLEELGNHAEFLGIMSMSEMLATFFIHDGGDTSKWRLKGHAEKAFWKWVCSWAVNIRMPSDLGFSDEGFVLPPLKIHEHLVETEAKMDGYLFSLEARTMSERRDARRSSLGDRVSFAADLISKSDQQSVAWCDLNAESESLTKAIPGAEEVRGTDEPEKKIETFMRFQSGELKTLITKSSIAGLGLNWQHCALTYYVGLSDSYERFYQSLRRFYRFGQKQPVNAHVITSTLEGAVLRNIQRKESDAARLQSEMMIHMKEAMSLEIRSSARQTIDYTPKTKMQLPSFL